MVRTAKQMTVTGPNEYVLGIVMELRATATPEGMMAVGLICGLAWQNNLQPNRAMLETASKVRSLQEALQLWDDAL